MNKWRLYFPFKFILHLICPNKKNQRLQILCFYTQIIALVPMSIWHLTLSSGCISPFFPLFILSSSFSEIKTKTDQKHFLLDFHAKIICITFCNTLLQMYYYCIHIPEVWRLNPNGYRYPEYHSSTAMELGLEHNSKNKLLISSKGTTGSKPIYKLFQGHWSKNKMIRCVSTNYVVLFFQEA